MSRYTFAVCLSCGVQSQPIITGKWVSLREIVVAMDKMDWDSIEFRGNLVGYCPQCKDAKKQAV